MPNHVKQELRIEGPAEDIAALVEALGGRDKFGNLTLGDTGFIPRLIPMPDELDPNKGGPPSPQYTEEDEAKAEANTTKYGYGDWYAWANGVWGTKWGDYRTTVAVDEPTALGFDYESAWSPPHEALLRISQRFPNLTFANTFDDEGGNFCGHTVYLAGLEVPDESWYKGSDDYEPILWQWEDEEEEEEAEA